MDKLKEAVECYSNPVQREVLLGLLDNNTIKEQFFLTGGTALSVFYLHHRTSIDLDFFSTKKAPLDDIHWWMTRHWPGESKLINQGEYILQMLIKNIKVDIVYDPLSFDESREKYPFDNHKYVRIDSLKSITANKMSTIVGRREVKDFVDFFFLIRRIKDMDFSAVYDDARKKEGMFDDPPTVAYQLEGNLSFIKENEDLIPETLFELDLREFYTFYENLFDRIYHHKI